MKEIFLHEIRSYLTSGRLLVAFLLMTSAFLISLGMMNQEYEKRMENYNFTQSFDGDDYFYDKIWHYQYDENSSTNSDTLTLPMGVIKRPDPLLYIARGLDTEMRQAVEFIKTFPIFGISFQPEQEKNFQNLLYPSPDLLFIVKVLVSFLAIISSFNMICQEREKGTLKLMLSAGASRTSIFLGKYLGGLTAFITALSASYLIYVIVLAFATPFQLSGDAVARMALSYLAIVLISVVFFSAGSTISSFTRHSAPALVLSLFFWLLFVFIIPGVSSLLAKQFVPIESEEKVARTKFEKAVSMENEYSEKMGRRANSNSGSYGQRNDEIRPQINAELEKIDREHQRQKFLQVELTSNLARISPVGSLSQILTSLSRTGIEDYFMYYQDLETTRKTLDDAFTSALTNPEQMERMYAVGFYTTPEMKKWVADFLDMCKNATFRKADLSSTLQIVLIDYLLLFSFAMILLSISFFRFMRYDAR